MNALATTAASVGIIRNDERIFFARHGVVLCGERRSAGAELVDGDDSTRRERSQPARANLNVVIEGNLRNRDLAARATTEVIVGV